MPGRTFSVTINNSSGVEVQIRGGIGSWKNLPQGSILGDHGQLVLDMDWPDGPGTNWGYVWFEFPKPFPDQATSSGDNFKDSCFLVTSLVTNFPSTPGLRFCDIGLADQMNNRPSSSPQGAEPSTLFPLGKLGLKTVTKKSPGGLPLEVLITLRPTDVPVTGFTWGRGHSLWMSDLAKNPDIANKPISWLHLPGTHDSATFDGGGGLATNQDLDFYEQCKLGIRYFDIRLFKDNSGVKSREKLFWAYHGPSTFDVPWMQGPRAVGDTTTCCGQFDAFYQETAGSHEFFILQLRQGSAQTGGATKDSPPTQDEINAFWDTMQYYFRDKAVAKPIGGAGLPTLASMKNENARRFILWYPDKSKYHPTNGAFGFYDRYAWGPNEGWESWKDYDESLYKMEDPTLVGNYIDKHISDRAGDLAKREQFWVAQCQLTPPFSLMYSPKDYANGKRRYMNLYIMDKCGEELWVKNTSIIMADYPTGMWVERVLWMNYFLFFSHL